ncbi:MAG: type II secretion system F family protein [Candidatus Spechtbacterales bacterium]
MIFRYVAKTKAGAVRKGEMEAKNQLDLARVLRAEGFYVLSVEAVGEKGGSPGDFFQKVRTFDVSFGVLTSVPLEEKMIFSRNLSVMLSSGIQLTRALTVLTKQVKSKRFKRVVQLVTQDIERGTRFHEALRKHPDVFDLLYVSMVEAGETAGNLDDSLNILSDQMEKEHELRSRIRGAMMYPSVIVVVMVLIGIVMLATVIPTLEEVFAGFDAELPATTKAVLALGRFMSVYWWLVILALPVLGLTVRQMLKTAAGRKTMAWILLRTPLFKGLVTKINNALFARTLSSLISGGVSILDGLQISSHTVSNVYYEKSLVEAREGVKKGKGLHEILAQYPRLYTPLIIEMAEVGEETGKLAELFERTADFYEEEVHDATRNLSAVVEPVLMVVIGAVVGLFAISILQPIYGLLGSI